MVIPFHIRMVMKIKMNSKGISEGDYRDWKAIRRWSEGLRKVFDRDRSRAVQRLNSLG